MTNQTTNMRREYHLAALDEATAARNPFDQFRRWFDDATKTPSLEPNAMVLATVDAKGNPSQRTVLLKHFDDEGFVFYTNYASQKGHDMAHHPGVSLLFYWPQLERQVRVLGTAARTSTAESDAYFASRPRGSQIGSVASPQSEPIPNRQWLAERFQACEREHGEAATIDRPVQWGGIRVTPHQFEFWQGRPNRLHDRLRYRLADGQWILERLAP